MMNTTLTLPGFLLAAVAVFIALSSSVMAGNDSVYAPKIKSVEGDAAGNVTITYTVMVESVWFCPGANAKKTDKGVELSFVRAWYKKRPKVDYPVKPDHGEQVVVIPSAGRPVFVNDGKKLVKVYPKK